jgi:D-alanyl-D-alanine carboxypeptidase
MRRAGSASGALVVDLATGRLLHSSRAGTERVPASVNKLNTTAAALLRFGPDATLETTRSRSRRPDRGGVVDGDLWLHGGGDPSFDGRRHGRSHASWRPPGCAGSRAWCAATSRSSTRGADRTRPGRRTGSGR